MADPEFARLFRYAENRSNFDIDVGATDTKPSLITTTTSYKNYTTILYYYYNYYYYYCYNYHYNYYSGTNFINQNYVTSIIVLVVVK